MVEMNKTKNGKIKSFLERIEMTDMLIDPVVYILYGLSKEETLMVAENAT